MICSKARAKAHKIQIEECYGMMARKIAAFCVSVFFLLLCAGCGATGVSGTWYSVNDMIMYNFSNGEIKVAGETVGQYEDNGDSAVISLTGDHSNLELYVTKMDGIDVLANVKKGEGQIYFCKGLDNAKKIFDEKVVDTIPVAGKYFDGSAFTRGTDKWSFIVMHFRKDLSVHIVDRGRLYLNNGKMQGVDPTLHYYGTYSYRNNIVTITCDDTVYSGRVEYSDNQEEMIIFGKEYFHVGNLEDFQQDTQDALNQAD